MGWLEWISANIVKTARVYWRAPVLLPLLLIFWFVGCKAFLYLYVFVLYGNYLFLLTLGSRVWNDLINRNRINWSYCIVLHCIVLYRIVSYRIVLYCTVLYCIVLYCIVLYYIVLYCIWYKKHSITLRSESDLGSCEATKVVARKAQKKFWSSNGIQKPRPPWYRSYDASLETQRFPYFFEKYCGLFKHKGAL